MKKLLLILLCLPMIGFGQNVNIPDANFKAYLVGDSFINTNGDSEIQVSEASAFVGDIQCQSLNISDLTGIEAFTALTYLNCGYNQLTTLDVSGATALYQLSCGDNQLTSLDVSNNTYLTSLYCSYNQLTSLNVSGATSLTRLYCQSNQLTSLDVSGATALIELDCTFNQLASLDVRNGNNTNMGFWNNLYWIFGPTMYGNPLTCVNIDDSVYCTANWDNTFNYSTNCPPPSAIQEHTTNKEILKVTDLLGRETKQTNQPLFYIYDDGTVEKRIVIE